MLFAFVDAHLIKQKILFGGVKKCTSRVRYKQHRQNFNNHQITGHLSELRILCDNQMISSCRYLSLSLHFSAQETFYVLRKKFHKFDFRVESFRCLCQLLPHLITGFSKLICLTCTYCQMSNFNNLQYFTPNQNFETVNT